MPQSLANRKTNNVNLMQTLNSCICCDLLCDHIKGIWLPVDTGDYRSGVQATCDWAPVKILNIRSPHELSGWCCSTSCPGGSNAAHASMWRGEGTHKLHARTTPTLCPVCHFSCLIWMYILILYILYECNNFQWFLWVLLVNYHTWRWSWESPNLQPAYPKTGAPGDPKLAVGIKNKGSLVETIVSNWWVCLALSGI